MSEGDERGRVLTDEERARAVREQLKSLHAFDLAYEMMVSLVSFGYQKLGLTGETAELRDLDDAHYAIELLGAVLKVSEREHPVSDLRDLHSTLAQMQLGYVQALELEGRRPEAPAEAGPAPEPPAAEEAPAAAPRPPAAPETPSEAEAAAAHQDTPDEVEGHLAADEAVEHAVAEKPARAARKPAAKKRGAQEARVKGGRRGLNRPAGLPGERTGHPPGAPGAVARAPVAQLPEVSARCGGGALIRQRSS